MEEEVLDNPHDVRIKITELIEERRSNRHVRDEKGVLQKKPVIVRQPRKVRVVTGGKRFAHFFVDYLLIQLILAIVTLLLTGYLVLPSFLSGEIGISFELITLGPTLLVWCGYYIVLEGMSQRTIGKLLTKTLVIDQYGNKPDLGTNILRNIIRMVPFEMLSCLADRGWHDTWSNTFVVTQEEYLVLQDLLAEARSAKKEPPGKPITERLY